MTYLRWPSASGRRDRSSIHVLVTFTRDGGAITRCGRRVRPPIDELPGLTNERSCETCLRAQAKDIERSTVEDDPVPEPPVEDDPVPE